MVLFGLLFSKIAVEKLIGKKIKKNWKVTDFTKSKEVNKKWY